MSIFHTIPARRILTRLSVSPFRLVSYVLHATGLDHIYKPHFTRHSALLEINDAVIAKLPKHSLSVTGARMDPMNLVFVGSELDIKLAFKDAGWFRANPASPVHLLYGLLTVITGRSYQTGPFSPHFISIGLQDFAFQKTTRGKSFKQRHHLRIWRTGIVLPEKTRVWVGTSSFDTKLKLQLTPPYIHHTIDPDIDAEREFVVRSLENQGAFMLKHIRLNVAVPADVQRKNAHGSTYFTDGKAAVVEV